MDASDRTNAMAQWMWDARTRRLPYRNLPAELKPASLREAYAAQEAYYRLAEPVYGAVCGAIFARTIHYSPAHVHVANFVNVRIESEIALMLGADLPAAGAPWRRDMVAPAVSAAMPAFELIEDRNADYTKTEAVSLVVENCWNGGIVIGAAKSISPALLNGIAGRLEIGGKPAGKGFAEDPCATLAWLANHLAERGRGLKAGMVVITGSVIATMSIKPGDRAVFTVAGLGDVEVVAV